MQRRSHSQLFCSNCCVMDLRNNGIQVMWHAAINGAIAKPHHFLKMSRQNVKCICACHTKLYVFIYSMAMLPSPTAEILIFEGLLSK